MERKYPYHDTPEWSREAPKALAGANIERNGARSRPCL